MYTWPLFIVKRFKEKPVVDTLLSSCVRIRTSDNLAFKRSIDCFAICAHNIVSVVDPRPTKKTNTQYLPLYTKYKMTSEGEESKSHREAPK